MFAIICSHIDDTETGRIRSYLLKQMLGSLIKAHPDRIILSYSGVPINLADYPTVECIYRGAAQMFQMEHLYQVLLTLELGDTEELGEMLGLTEELGDTLALGDTDGLTEALGDTLGLTEELGDTEGETDALGLTEADGLTDGLTLEEGLTLGDGETPVIS